MKTAPRSSPRICNRKKRFETRMAAEEVALSANVTLRVYKCELCHQYHLTSRTKGMKSLPARTVKPVT